MPPLLPGELADAIISYVDDASSLCSCSLVCHDWVAASRHRLFSDTHILSPSQYNAFVNRVLRHEDMYPWLSYVQTLELDCEDRRWFKKRAGGPRYRFFHEFAGHLPNLRLLSLVGHDWVRSPLHASTPSAVSLFPSLIELRLENCTFQSFDMFRRILVALPVLSTLTLYAVQWPSQPSGMLPGARLLPQPRPSLVAFSIQFYAKNDCAGTLFDWLVNCTPSKSTIRQLRFTLGGSPSASIKPEHAQFLENVSASVKSLRIQARGESFPSLLSGYRPLFIQWAYVLVDDFPISCFPKLTHLMVKGSWEGICGVLNGCASPLRVLQIESVPTRVLSVAELGPRAASREDEDGGADMTGGLGELDALLEDDRFKTMERLEFTVSPVPREFNFMLCLVEGRFRESIEERLPRLCKRGIRVVPTLLNQRGLSQRAAMHLSRQPAFQGPSRLWYM